MTCRTLILVPSRGFSPLTTVKAFFPAQVDCQSRHEDGWGIVPRQTGGPSGVSAVDAMVPEGP